MQVEGPANMYVENESVVESFTIPESIIKEIHLLIYYHDVCEVVAGGKFCIGWVPTGINPADLLTKVLEGLNIREIVSKVIN